MRFSSMEPTLKLSAMGPQKTFSGKLPHHPIVATTVRIHDSDDDESFTDEFTDDLRGSKTGTGTINRFTGEWTVTFTRCAARERENHGQLFAL